MGNAVEILSSGQAGCAGVSKIEILRNGLSGRAAAFGFGGIDHACFAIWSRHGEAHA